MEVSCIVIYIAAILASCEQQKAKEQEQADKPPLPTILEKLDNDSLFIHGYLVSADTAYFFATADSSVKLNTYLVKDEFASVFKFENDYAAVAKETDSGTYHRGWLPLKDLTKARLTAPRIIKE